MASYSWREEVGTFAPAAGQRGMLADLLGSLQTLRRSSLVAVILLSAPVQEAGFPVVSSLFRHLPARVRAGRSMLLRDGSGRAVPALFLPCHSHWLLHALLPPAPGKVRRLFAPLGRHEPLPPRLLVAREGDEIALSSGVHQWTLGKEGEVGGPGWKLSVWPPSGGGGWTISQDQGLFVEACYRGRLGGAPGGPPLELHATLYAASDHLELSLLVQSRRGALLSRGLGMRLSCQNSVGLAGEKRVLRADTEGRLLWREKHGWQMDRGLSFKPLWPDAWSLVGRQAPALRFSGIERAQWLSLEPGGREFRWLTTPRGVRLQPGEGRILRLSLSALGRRPVAVALVRPRSIVKRAGGGTPLEPRVRPSILQPLLERRVRDFLADPRSGFVRAGPDAGDWRMSATSVGNLEFDTTLGLLLHGLRKGQVAAFEAGLLAADHLLARDRDAAGSGLFFPHGAGHRASPVEVGHHWVEGLLLAADATNDALLRGQVSQVLADQLRTFQEQELDQLLPRSRAWGLLALAAGSLYQTRSRPYRRELRRWRRWILDHQHRRGLVCQVPFFSSTRIFQENPFVQGGILAPALLRSLLAAPSSRGAKALTRLVRFLSENAVVTEQGVPHLARRILFDRESARVLSRFGEAPGEQAALFLAGLARSAPRLRRRPLLRRLLAALPRNLRLSHRRYMGAELSQLLRAAQDLEGW